MAELPPTPRFLLEMRCRACGCTDSRACEGGCAWAAFELCTRCAPGEGWVEVDLRTSAEAHAGVEERLVWVPAASLAIWEAEDRALQEELEASRDPGEGAGG